MRRSLDDLADKTFDVLIIGGGIFGVCAAWDAILRGLSVALVERNDFSSGASANCYKIAHGGLRYLQHGDLWRVYTSSRDQTALLRIAPHLVKPLPIVVPTYGHGLKGKEFLFAGLTAYHIITSGKNRGVVDRFRRIGLGKMLDLKELLELFPGVSKQGLTGGVTFYDGQIYSPPRLAVAFLQSACSRGVVAANHVEVTKLLRTGDRIVGGMAFDRLGNEVFEIRARQTLNATGGWSDHFIDEQLGQRYRANTVYSRDACFVVPRKFDHEYALAVSAQTSDPDALLNREARHLFVVPWRDKTIIGVWHKITMAEPHHVGLSKGEVLEFAEELNLSYPDLIELGSVEHTNYGLVPFGENQRDGSNLSYGKRSLLVDHAEQHDLKGLVSLIGVRYTVARSDAQRAVDLLATKLGNKTHRPGTAHIPLHGGDFDSFDQLIEVIHQNLAGISIDSARALAHNHGSRYTDVLNAAKGDFSIIADSDTLKAEVINAVETEMAVTLDDVVFRRTDLGSAGLSPLTLDCVSRVMAAKCRWSENKRKQEYERCLKLTGLDRTSSIFKEAL